MVVTGPQRALFLASLGIGVVSLLLLDAVFAPSVIAQSADASELVRDAGAVRTTDERPATNIGSATTTVPSVRVVIPAAARVPTIVARFESESKEPSDQTGIRALATAMIEDHEVAVVLEGHSDTRGGEDYNHEISLGRAEWVKSRLVVLGVSPDRIETVGLGATRPLRPSDTDAQAVNRRVEIRWMGR